MPLTKQLKIKSQRQYLLHLLEEYDRKELTTLYERINKTPHSADSLSKKDLCVFLLRRLSTITISISIP